MLAVDKDSIKKSIGMIKDKLANQETKAEGIADVEKLIDMKQVHVWRADAGSCIGNACNISALVEFEIDILQNVLDAVKQDNNDKAATLLDDYLTFVDKHYENERTQM